MPVAVLFTATVLIWGTTWIAIAFQVDEVPVLVSVFYRFLLASVLMLAGLWAMGRLKRPAQWRFVIVQALCLFCFNFVGLYNATTLIPSGLVSVIFSLASILNAINARIFFGERITGRVVLAGLLGVGGLALLFWQDLAIAADTDTLHGIGWAVWGTLFFSWGNMASRANGARGVGPVTATAWGMGIGALALLALLLARGEALIPANGWQSLSPRFWGALFYLALVGSIVGFTAYLQLVAKAGSARAGYATVLFPVVALIASSVFEGFHWTPLTLTGLALAGLGNIIMFRRKD